MKNDHAILALCQNLGVSPSGYYAWLERRRTPGPRAQANQQLAGSIQTIHAQSRQTYGSPRVQQVLRQQGHRHGRKRIARLMQAAASVAASGAATASAPPTATTTTPSRPIVWRPPPRPPPPIKFGYLIT